MKKNDPCINCGESFQRHTPTEDGMYLCPSNKLVLEDGASTIVPLGPGHFQRGIIHQMKGSGA